MSGYVSAALIPAAKTKTLLDALEKGAVGKLKREDFVIIDEDWISLPTLDFFGADEGSDAKPPAYLCELSKTAPVLTFAFGPDMPEWGLGVFDKGELKSLLGFYPDGERKTEYIEKFDFGLLKLFDISDDKISELKTFTGTLGDLDEDECGYTYDTVQEILGWDFEKFTADRKDFYDEL